MHVLTYSNNYNYHYFSNLGKKRYREAFLFKWRTGDINPFLMISLNSFLILSAVDKPHDNQVQNNKKLMRLDVMSDLILNMTSGGCSE